MKRLKILAALGTMVGVLGFPVHGFADPPQWVTNVTPIEVIVGKFGDAKFVQILVSGAVINPGTCASPNSYMIYDADLVNDALAINLAAIASGRPIRAYVLDQCDGNTGRPLISAIGLM